MRHAQACYLLSAAVEVIHTPIFEHDILGCVQACHPLSAALEAATDPLTMQAAVLGCLEAGCSLAYLHPIEGTRPARCVP